MTSFELLYHVLGTARIRPNVTIKEFLILKSNVKGVEKLFTVKPTFYADFGALNVRLKNPALREIRLSLVSSQLLIRLSRSSRSLAT